MSTPVLQLIAGPNGAGKSTYFERILSRRIPGLEFFNADQIAAERWPNDAEARSYEAAQIAAERRSEAISSRTSFVTETVFSHPSKLDLIRQAKQQGFLVSLHVILIPEELSVARVASRVRLGGHSVPEEKIRQRYRRLWALVQQAIELSDQSVVRDNSTAAAPFRPVARFRLGRLLGESRWPPWTPDVLREKY